MDITRLISLNDKEEYHYLERLNIGFHLVENIPLEFDNDELEHLTRHGVCCLLTNPGTSSKEVAEALTTIIKQKTDNYEHHTDVYSIAYMHIAKQLNKDINEKINKLLKKYNESRN